MGRVKQYSRSTHKKQKKSKKRQDKSADMEDVPSNEEVKTQEQKQREAALSVGKKKQIFKKEKAKSIKAKI